MKKAIIYGTLLGYNSVISTCLWNKDKINIVGILAHDHIDGSIDGIPVIQIQEISSIDFDYCIIGREYNYINSYRQLLSIGLKSSQILSQTVMEIPGFNFEKYSCLCKLNLTIISSGCMGGFLYHLFKLPFLSPTINLSFPEESFIKFSSNLYKYLNSNLLYLEDAYNAGDKHNYPVCRLGKDVIINMVHYRDFKEANKKWNERKCRINWKNILYLMTTDDEYILEKFDSTLIGNKICLVPFKSDIASAWYLPSNLRSEYYESVNNAHSTVAMSLCEGSLPAYDLWDMLLHCKKTPRMSILE